ncbi:hypothetical protein EDD85DRAFT_974646, partial [Armillaria nabsnona]
GCLATVFACTWLAVHPNVPGRNITSKGAISCAIERAKIMAVAILAPEVIVAWAAEQFIVAWNVCRKEQYAPNLTMAHGFVLSMGGFCYTKAGPVFPSTMTSSILRLDDLDSHPQLMTQLEQISAETIEDKSKGDGLSKTISKFQISWFIAQCAAQVIQHLPMTLLEMTALAFAGLTINTYSLWWYKPLNIRYHISLDGDHRLVSETCRLRESASPAESRMKKNALSWSRLRIQPVINGLVELLFLGTLRAVSGGIGYDIGGIIYDIEDGGDDIENGAFRFSSGTRCQAPWVRIGIMVAVGSIFGAFHCAAWSFYFPSHAEMVLWRYASMTVLVGLVVAFLPTGHLLIFIFTLLTRTGTVAYIVARIILIVLAFMQLRFLPPLAFHTVQWTTYLPHI